MGNSNSNSSQLEGLKTSTPLLFLRSRWLSPLRMKISTLLTIVSGLLFVAEYPTAKYLLVEIDDTDVEPPVWPDYPIPDYPDYPDNSTFFGVDAVDGVDGVDGATIGENILKGGCRRRGKYCNHRPDLCCSKRCGYQCALRILGVCMFLKTWKRCM